MSPAHNYPFTYPSDFGSCPEEEEEGRYASMYMQVRVDIWKL